MPSEKPPTYFRIYARDVLLENRKLCQSLINHLLCHRVSQMKPTCFNPLSEILCVPTPLSNHHYCCLPLTPRAVATVFELSTFQTTVLLPALQSSAATRERTYCEPIVNKKKTVVKVVTVVKRYFDSFTFLSVLELREIWPSFIKKCKMQKRV